MLPFDTIYCYMLQVVKVRICFQQKTRTSNILVPSDTISTDKDKLLLTEVVLQVNVDI